MTIVFVRHRLRPAQAVAQDAEEEASRGPADQEDRGHVAADLLDVLLEADALLGRQFLQPLFVLEADVLGLRVDQILDRHLADQVEEVLVHRVEEPAQSGDDQDDPAVLLEALVPLERLRAGGLIHVSPVLVPVHPLRDAGMITKRLAAKKFLF
jgi:hypothetical protein